MDWFDTKGVRDWTCRGMKMMRRVTVFEADSGDGKGNRPRSPACTTPVPNSQARARL
ncbi:hypothetical protein T492DRAFT_922811, partial [Pavlovales sp. CCMP2436]